MLHLVFSSASTMYTVQYILYCTVYSTLYIVHCIQYLGGVLIVQYCEIFSIKMSGSYDCVINHNYRRHVLLLNRSKKSTVTSQIGCTNSNTVNFACGDTKTLYL